MQKHQVKTPSDALVYITDCTLATVAHLRLMKSASKRETNRQISIAQFAIDNLVGFEADILGTRIEKVVKDFNGSVKAWADQFKP